MDKLGLHLDEESAEKYSMGKLSDRKTSEVEKHLLICESCQKAVSDADAYVAAMKKAAAKAQQTEQRKNSQRRVAGR